MRYFFLAGFFVVPGPGLDLAFDVELGAFFDVVADDLGGAVEGDEVVPLGLVGPVALGVFGAVGSGESEAGYLSYHLRLRGSLGLCLRCRGGELY